MRYIAKLSLIFFLPLTTQANANTKVICEEKRVHELWNAVGHT